MANAVAAFAHHAIIGMANWRFGASLGAAAGKAVAGQRLLMLFALMMIVIAFLMFRARR